MALKSQLISQVTNTQALADNQQQYSAQEGPPDAKNNTETKHDWDVVPGDSQTMAPQVSIEVSKLGCCYQLDSTR